MAETIKPRVYGVAEIIFYLREYLAEDAFLGHLAVQGEISGYKSHRSGHIYFSLKDKECTLRTVMFRSAASRLTWQPRDGDRVVALGRIALYEKDGACQLYAENIFPAGDGEQAKALAELKKKLAAEGLFAPERKKPLPAFAADIGVVTSGEGAAWTDIRRIAYARNPRLKLTLYPASVQGERAPYELAAATARADRGGHDILIIGLGGGAEADLAAFNSEPVVRAIAAARTPVISAVGHESDFSLCDLAADMRAATPSHAAALAVTDFGETERTLQGIDRALNRAMGRYLLRLKEKLAAYDPAKAVSAGLRRHNQRLAVAAARLEALSPLATLNRGYALVELEDGTLIRRADKVRVGDRINVYPAQGRIRAVVEGTDNG